VESDAHTGIGSIAIIRASGCVELWARDLFSWHNLAVADICLPQRPLVYAVFSAPSLLWIVVAELDVRGQDLATEADLATSARVMLYARSSVDTLKLVSEGPCLEGVPSPWLVPLKSATNAACGDGAHGIAVALAPIPGRGLGCPSVCLFGPQWANAGQACENRVVVGVAEICTIPMRCRSANADDAHRLRIGGMWPLPPRTTIMRSSSSADAMCFSVWVVPDGALGGGELQVYSGGGECLAVLPMALDSCCLAVPPQGECPAEVFEGIAGGRSVGGVAPFVLVLQENASALGGAKWIVALAIASNEGGQQLQLSPLRDMPSPYTRRSCSMLPSPKHGVIAASGCLLSCWFPQDRRCFVVDWEHLHVQALPEGWVSLAVAYSTFILGVVEEEESSQAALRRCSDFGQARYEFNPGIVQELLLLEPY